MDVPELPCGAALFLDFDGTLVDLAASPDTVAVEPGLPALLGRVSARLGGALAVVSGRQIATLDRLLGAAVNCLAGLHGLEHRSADGTYHLEALPEHELHRARVALHAFVMSHEGVLLEDKTAALALHYRNAPQHEGACRRIMTELQERSGGTLRLQAGKMVWELRAMGRHKGDAVVLFMRERPFAGRVPIFVGDDVTDEDSFRLVNAEGGISIRVGGCDGSVAQHALADVAAVHRWLSSVADQEDRQWHRMPT